MRKALSGRPALHRTAAGDRIGEVGLFCVEGRIAEIGMVRQPPGVRLVAIVATEHGVVLAVARYTTDGSWLLVVQSVQALGKFLGAVEGAARRSRRHGGEGAAGQGAEPVLAGKHAACRKDAPADEVASRDLTERKGPMDLGAVVPGPLGLPLPDPRCFR